MKKQFTKLLAVTLVLLLSAWSVNAQSFVWDKSELTVAWANASAASTIKSQNGVTLSQIRTAGVIATNNYIDIANTNQTLLVNSATSDAVTITSASDNITSIKITYSSNGSTTTATPYIGYNPAPTALGVGDAATAVAVTSSCEITSVYGNVGMERTYTPPVGTKFAILVRPGTSLSCGTEITSTATTIRIYRIEVFTTPSIPTISSFTVAGVNATINQTTKTINAELPYGTNLTALTPTVVLGGTATSYSPLGAQNFSAGSVNYTATDGAVNTNYAVTITASSTPSNDATLSDLKVDGVTVTSFNAATISYDVIVPFAYVGMPVVGATVNNVAAQKIISQATAIPGAATVTVTAQDNTTQKVYNVNFTRTPASTAKDISAFSIGTKAGIITEQNILVKMHLTTNVANLTPTVTVSNLATYSPQGAQDFTNPVNYIVTAEDGTQKTYIVTVQLVDMVFNGPYPYETNFPTGYELPDWISSPTLGGATFIDPYGSGSTGSDKILWYDNQTETDAAIASVIRLGTGASIEFSLSKCELITAHLSATGNRTYRLYVNDELKVTSATIARDTKVTLSYNVNLNQPVIVKINTVESTGGATLGYLKVESSFGSGISTNKMDGVYFDGQIIQNANKFNLQLFDIRGRLLSESKQNINLGNYPKGVYIVKSNENTIKIALTK